MYSPRSTVALALLALAVVVGALWLARRALPAPRRGWPRVLAAIGTLVVGALAFLPAFALATAPMRSGTWTCLVCGLTEERESWAGFPVASREPGAHDRELARPYRDWYARTVGTEHRHDWRMTGCHRVGLSTIACTMLGAPAELLQRSLPALPDPTLARAMVERLLDAPPAERTELTRCFEPWSQEAGPFGRIARGERMTPEEFAEEHRAWLTRNEAWR